MTTPKEAVSAAPTPQGELSHGYTVERHAREMVGGHFPKHREYLVAAAYLEQAAALAASEARVARIDEAYMLEWQAHCDTHDKLTAAEQSLAEARALLRDEAALLRAWARESRDGGWSTHQFDPMNRRAAAIDALLPKGEGETS